MIEQKHPDKNWSTIWKRLKSGVFSSEARSFLYLLIHERVGTKERGNRLMPGRFPSPNCNLSCPPGQPESILHRYSQCSHVSEAWELVRYQLSLLDISLNTTSDMDILSLNFEKGLWENALLWMIGVFVEVVESEVVLKRNKLNTATILGIFKQRKQNARYQALPELGIIPGLDTDSQGIG